MCIALIDANAFYCSAQTLFEPWYRDKPVVVASNNDGSVVSRNDPAKALGIKMSQPIHELEDLMESGQLRVYSSNYGLYQSLSNRIMAVLEELAPQIFPYSVDECFADLAGIPDPEAWAIDARDQIQRRLGMPVGVGIGPTKTLAKLANWAAKKWKAKTGCVVDLRDPGRQEKLLRYAPVEEVWGIGSRLSERLRKELNVTTAWQLANTDPKLLRRFFNVNVERTARELVGTRCFDLAEGTPERKQQIICSRSFGKKLTELDHLKGAVTAFATLAASKLREQGSLANCVQVFARTSAFSKGEQYSNARIIELPYPTADTREIVQAALGGLQSLYREGPKYAKAGVMLTQFVDRAGYTDDLFAPKPRQGSEALMKVMDAINAKEGRGTIKLARDTRKAPWAMRRAMLSPAYTTDWKALPKAR